MFMQRFTISYASNPSSSIRNRHRKIYVYVQHKMNFIHNNKHNTYMICHAILVLCIFGTCRRGSDWRLGRSWTLPSIIALIPRGLECKGLLLFDGLEMPHCHIHISKWSDDRRSLLSHMADSMVNLIFKLCISNVKANIRLIILTNLVVSSSFVPLGTLNLTQVCLIGLQCSCVIFFCYMSRCV